MLRDYQETTVNEVREAYIQKYNTPLVVLPTGAGKTVVFCHIAQTSVKRGKRVLILVHRVELLRQTSAKLNENGVNHGLINPKFTPNLNASVQVASVQTLVNRLSKINAPDLIIIDEAHHSTAGSWNKIINFFPNVKILGVTATPCRSDGTGLGNIFDKLIVGPQIAELIQRGFLVKPIVYAPASRVDLKSIKITRGDYDKDQIAQLIDKPRITGDAVSHYMRIADGMPAVVFCISVMHSQHVAEEFRARGYKAFSVDGTMEDSIREKLLSGLGNGSVDIITSCDLISEGTDIPAIGCAILLRPTMSTGLYLQQLGRALRLSEGKTKAIILDHVGNTLIHGMPDMIREWSLEGSKKTKKSISETGIRVLQCSSCFAMFEPNVGNTCDVCGESMKISAREIEQIEGELVKLSDEEIVIQKKEKQEQVRKARTLEELLKIQKENGYKYGWAQHMFNARNKKMLQIETPAKITIKFDGNEELINLDDVLINMNEELIDLNEEIL
jgi:superfamily II DNA or RNA helicase